MQWKSIPFPFSSPRQLRLIFSIVKITRVSGRVQRHTISRIFLIVHTIENCSTEDLSPHVTLRVDSCHRYDLSVSSKTGIPWVFWVYTASFDEKTIL